VVGHSLVGSLAQMTEVCQLGFGSLVLHRCKFKIFTEPFLCLGSHFLAPLCFGDHHFSRGHHTGCDHSFSDVTIDLDLVTLASHIRIDPVIATAESRLVGKQVTASSGWVSFTSIRLLSLLNHCLDLVHSGLEFATVLLHIFSCGVLVLVTGVVPVNPVEGVQVTWGPLFLFISISFCGLFSWSL